MNLKTRNVEFESKLKESIEKTEILENEKKNSNFQSKC